MNTQHIGRTVGALVLVAGLLVGAMIAYAATTTFKIKENKIFFNLVSDDTVNSPTSDPQELFNLPSLVGRTGHVYIIRAVSGVGGNDGVAVQPMPEETTSNSGTGPLIVFDGSSVTLVADEENNTWWVID
jgi:hypothetical protein